MIQVVHKSTGVVVGVFREYVEARDYRRDVLPNGPDEYALRGVA